MNTIFKTEQYKEAFEIDIKSLIRETNTKGVVLLEINPVSDLEISINNNLYNAEKPFKLESQFHPITNAFLKIKFKNAVNKPLAVVRYLLVTE